MTAVTIPLPWTSPPLSGNRERTNVHAYAAKVRDAKVSAQWAIRNAKPKPMTGANITLHFRVATMRRRDADNLSPVLKVVQDALVAEGINFWGSVKGDTPKSKGFVVIES